MEDTDSLVAGDKTFIPHWRAMALAPALAVSAALAIQLAMSIAERGLAGGLWRLAGFFTILTNALVVAVAWALATGRTRGLGGPHMRLMAVNSIVLTGIIYVALLQGMQDPQGWHLLTDRLFHWASPVLFLLAWLSAPHGALRWRSAAYALAWPLGYCAYAMIRGHFDGFYAYWFLDPATQSLGQFTLSFAVLAAVFYAFALGFVALDRWLAGRGERALA